MNKLKLFLPLVFIAIICSCVERNEKAFVGGNSLFNSESTKTTHIDSIGFKIDTISKVVKEWKRWGVEQNGVCDTCLTGYQSAIIENRMVAEELSKQTEILDEKVDKIYRQIKRTDSLIASNNAEISKLKSLNYLTKIKHKKQKNEFYALTKGD